MSFLTSVIPKVLSGLGIGGGGNSRDDSSTFVFVLMLFLIVIVIVVTRSPSYQANRVIYLRQRNI